MNIFEIILIGLSLSMDAFTVSISKGISSSKEKGIITAFFFGLFQFIMPLLGYFIGNKFSERIIYYNPYISTILLITIGILIIKEKDNEELRSNLNLKELFLLSIATSIDALVIGISFSFLKVNIISSSIIIGIITFIMCIIGYYFGNLLNKKVGKYSNFISGIILILLGIKIFIENLNQF